MYICVDVFQPKRKPEDTWGTYKYYIKIRPKAPGLWEN